MARSEAEEFQLFAGRVQPIYHQLFNLAHAITGNCDQAEYALQAAMLDCWIRGDAAASRHAFRESLRSSVIHSALRAGQKGEMDWNGLNICAEDGDALSLCIAQEGAELRRLLALRYGCGLSPRRIARLIGQDTSRVQNLIARFDARNRRKLPAHERRFYDRHIVRAVRSLLLQPYPQAPEMGSVLRTLQADAADAPAPNRLPARIVHHLLLALVALFCIIAFWLIAVLMQPAVLQAPNEAISNPSNIEEAIE